MFIERPISENPLLSTPISGLTPILCDPESSRFLTHRAAVTRSSKLNSYFRKKNHTEGFIGLGRLLFVCFPPYILLLVIEIGMHDAPPACEGGIFINVVYSLGVSCVSNRAKKKELYSTYVVLLNRR